MEQFDWFMRPLLTLLLISSAAIAQRTPLEPLDLLQLETLGATAVSPDGKWLVYTKSQLDWKKGRRTTNLFLAPMTGGDARQMTFGLEHEESGLDWMTDSSAFFYLSDRDGGKKQIYRMPVDGGEAVKLTSEKDDVRDFEPSRDGRWLVYRTGPSGARTLKILELTNADAPPRDLTDGPHGVLVWKWHPDSSGVIYTSPKEDETLDRKRDEKGFNVRVNDEPKGKRSLWFIQAASGEKREVADLGEWAVDTFEPSPDGKLWALQTTPLNRYATTWDQEIQLLDLPAGKLERLTSNSQGEGNPTFSPDGRWLAYTAPDDAQQYRAERVFLARMPSGETRELAAQWPHDAAIDAWTRDGRSILFTSTIGLNRQVYSLPLNGSDPEPLSSGDQVLNFSLDRESGALLVRRSTPEEPAELYAASWDAPGDASRWVKLTSTAEELAERALGTYEAFRWKSSDGAEVEGVLVKPVGFEEGTRYPLIVQVHGGPAGTSTNAFAGSWSTYAHVWAGRGYLVFQPNYRGSSGYGEDFRRAIAGDYFRQGFDDIMTGVDALIEKGLADPDKMGHMGWSAGGHWSNWALTHTDRFKAIASGAGAVNWLSMWAQSDMQINREFYFEGKPYENREHYLEVSPIAYIENAKTPTLIFCGTSDPRVPNPQSRELYMSLKNLGVPVEYIEFPGQGHGLTNPRYELVKMEAELAWFDKWIHGKDGWLDWEKLLGTIPK
jgi:dipeptidyl aminopeptidase/acylaminoacyl peptidase